MVAVPNESAIRSGSLKLGSDEYRVMANGTKGAEILVAPSEGQGGGGEICVSGGIVNKKKILVLH